MNGSCLEVAGQQVKDCAWVLAGWVVRTGARGGGIFGDDHAVFYYSSIVTTTI
jgi:hypothetical protein